MSVDIQLSHLNVLWSVILIHTIRIVIIIHVYQGRSQIFIGGRQAGSNMNLSIKTFLQNLKSRNIVLLIFKTFKCFANSLLILA